MTAGGAFALISVPFRLYLGAVFVVAGHAKILEPFDFALSIATYQILPLSLINLFAILLPWLELFTGAFLIVGFLTKENAFLISLMMVMFTVALGIALSKGLQIDCGCFASGEAAAEISYRTLLRDLLWLAMGLFVWKLDDGRFGVDRFLGRHRHA